MVKIKDIAKKCNTSIATVSKALHNSTELSQETIKRIQQVAKEMGYVPNAYAQALKLKRSFSIGVIFNIPEMGVGLKHEYFSSILNSLKVEAESKGYAITFLSKNPNNNMTYLQLAKFRNMDGVIIVSEDFTNPEIIELVNSSLPCVTIDYIFGTCSAIMSDNNEGTERLVAYAYLKGHRKIAYIHGEQTDVTSRRIASFVKGMRSYGLEVREDYLLAGSYHDPRTSGKLAKSLFSNSDRPTCILFPDDISMLGGITALTQEGYIIPDDVSVIGYDGTELSRIYRPMMTTYVQNSKELGAKAAIELIKQIEDPLSYLCGVFYCQGEIQEGKTVKEI